MTARSLQTLAGRIPFNTRFWLGKLAAVMLPVLLGGVVALLVIVGTRVLQKPQLVLGIVSGVVYLFLAFRLPEYAILLLLAITSSIINPDYLPVLHLSSISFQIPDLLLGVLLLVTFLRMTSPSRHGFYPSPLFVPLLLFTLALVIGVLNAILIHGMSMNAVMRNVRPLIQWLLLIPVVQLVDSEQAVKRLIVGLCGLGVLFVAGIIIHDLVPSFPDMILPVNDPTLVTVDSEIGGVNRVYLDADRLLYVMIPIALAWLALNSGAIGQAALQSARTRPIETAGMLIALGLAVFWLLRSFQRNYWGTAALNVVLLFLLLTGRQRLRLVRHLLPLALIGVVAALVLAMAMPQAVDRLVGASVGRAASLDPTTLATDSSIQWRESEIQYAMVQVVHSPIIGIGIATPYRPPLVVEESGSYLLDYFVHNTYLWLMVMMGLVGLIPFLWLCLAFTARALVKQRTIRDPILRGFVLGLGVAFVGILIGNFVGPSLILRWSQAMYPGLIGIVEVIYRLDQRQKEATCVVRVSPSA